MKKEIFKSHWRMYTVYTAGVLFLAGLAGFYFFLYAPQTRIKAFINDTETTYSQSKGDISYMNSAVNDWEVFVRGDLASKTTQLIEIKDNFASFKSELEALNIGQETEELYSILMEYAERGYKVSNNLIIISEYFKKVEVAVAAFNNLDTETDDIDELKRLVLDFESVSTDSLADLELIEAPDELLEIDKDYKDLLRQYIQSASDLSDAIDSNDTNKVEKVGKKADEEVNAISRQLNSDLDNFSENSNISEDLEILLSLRGKAEEKINILKTQYGI